MEQVKGRDGVEFLVAGELSVGWFGEAVCLHQLDVGRRTDGVDAVFCPHLGGGAQIPEGDLLLLRRRLAVIVRTAPSSFPTYYCYYYYYYIALRRVESRRTHPRQPLLEVGKDGGGKVACPDTDVEVIPRHVLSEEGKEIGRGGAAPGESAAQREDAEVVE